MSKIEDNFVVTFVCPLYLKKWLLEKLMELILLGIDLLG